MIILSICFQSRETHPIPPCKEGVANPPDFVFIFSITYCFLVYKNLLLRDARAPSFAPRHRLSKLISALGFGVGCHPELKRTFRSLARRGKARIPQGMWRSPSARYFVSLSMTRDVRVNCYIISSIYGQLLYYLLYFQHEFRREFRHVLQVATLLLVGFAERFHPEANASVARVICLSSC